MMMICLFTMVRDLIVFRGTAVLGTEIVPPFSKLARPLYIVYLQAMILLFFYQTCRWQYWLLSINMY
jgi:hypothetical protein